MNLSDIFKRQLIKLFFITLISVVFYSCGKKNEPQGNKTETPKSETGKTETDKKETGLSNDFIVTYELEGKLKGKMDISRSGEKFKQNMNSEIMGMQTSTELYIVDKNVYSIVDVAGKKIGTKTDLSNYNSQKKSGETITDFKEFEKFLDSKKITGTENILGYNCDIYEISNNVSLSVYDKRYILKIKSPEFTATAVSLNTSPAFSKDEFEIPTGIDFNSTDMRGLNKKNLDSLVNKFKK